MRILAKKDLCLAWELSIAMFLSIALLGCGASGPVDEDGLLITADRLGQYALVIGDDHVWNVKPGVYKFKTYLGSSQEAYVNYAIERFAIHSFAVEAGYRYKLPSGDVNYIVVSRRDDSAEKELDRFELVDTEQRRERNNLGKYLDVKYLTYFDKLKRLNKQREEVRANAARQAEEEKLAQNRAAEEKRLEDERAAQKQILDAQNARVERIAQLRGGAIKPADIKDAYLLLDGEINRLPQLMASPLLKPDNAIFGGRVTLDAEEKAKLLRARVDANSLQSIIDSPLQAVNEDTVNAGFFRQLQAAMTGNGMQHDGGRYYAQLKLNNKSVNFSENTMRIGSAVWVLGRYVSNRKYKTVSGTERTMPVLEVLYISE